MKGRSVGAALMLVVMLFSACTKDEKVGSEELLKQAKEGEAGKRLGEFLKSPEPTNKSGAAIGGPSPSAQPSASANQGKQVIEVALVGDNPYYNPGPNVQIPAGAIIRITNKDDKTRYFQTPDGPYDSGPIEPGKSKDIPSDFKGKFALQDPSVPFATGSLEVF